EGGGRGREVACATGQRGRPRPDSRLAERSPNQVRPRKQKRSVTGDGGRGVSGGTPPHLAGCSPLPPEALRQWPGTTFHKGSQPWCNASSSISTERGRTRSLRRRVL